MSRSIRNKKVLALMSGGVDSSTAAALLVEKGYEVSGVYLKFWQSGRGGGTGSRRSQWVDRISPQLGDECWALEMRDAAKVAAKLNIPFQVWDVTAEYKTRVLADFYQEYAAGRTPNPDVLCNSEIKFGVALERAVAMGYDYVATGHYGRIVMNQESRIKNYGLENGKSMSNSIVHNALFMVQTAVDPNKDQSYFLWRLTQDQLSRVMFPIGEYTKAQVRAMARRFGLHNWNKKDSQGVCFLGKIKLKEFLYGRSGRATAAGATRGPAVKRRKGPIMDIRGNRLGLHDGLAHFTIGQRHGTRLGGTGPYFVVEKNLTSNTLIVANKIDEPKYRASGLRITNEEFRIANGLKCFARTRYRAPLVPVTVSPLSGSAEPLSGEYQVTFDTPQRAVAPGQSVVFYNDTQVIGGGIIADVQFRQQSL